MREPSWLGVAGVGVVAGPFFMRGIGAKDRQSVSNPAEPGGIHRFTVVVAEHVAQSQVAMSFHTLPPISFLFFVILCHSCAFSCILAGFSLPKSKMSLIDAA